MKNTFFYLSLIVWFISFFVNKPFNLFNLIILGILIKLVAEKKKTGTYPLWTIIIFIGIIACNFIIGLGAIIASVRMGDRY